jgi:putative membrane-bound dehydrogenase-like protein
MRSLLAAALIAPSALAAVEIPSVPPKSLPGWKLELVASAPVIRHPSVVCTAPDGRVFVAEDPMDIRVPANAAQGRILCFHPDGHRTIFATNLHAVFGMQYIEGKLYVLHNPKFTVFADGSDEGTNSVDLIESTNPNPWALDWNDHVPANFRLAMDGYFYVAVGDKGIYGAVGRDGKRVDLHGGGILRLRPDGTGLEVYCTGVRNILDVALNAEDELFTYDNTDEQQWMGRLTHMVEAGFYGYPYDFIPRRPYTLWMMADYGAGAATGALCYDDDALPTQYQGNLFFGDFGKRQVMRVHIERDGATYRAVSKEDLFVDPPEDFRPVGIAFASDALGIYICDWQHRDVKDEKAEVGRLWKLISTNTTHAAPKPAWYLPAATGEDFQATTSDLIAGLSHPSKSVRLVAQRRLADRARRVPDSTADIVRSLAATLQSTSVPAHARWHAIWALDAIDGGIAGQDAILTAGSDHDPSVRRQAVRQLGTAKVRSALPLIIELLSDADTSVRFQVATALGRIGAASAVAPLARRLGEHDFFARYAVFTALNRIGRADPKAWPEIAGGLESTNTAIREGTVFALHETYDPVLVGELIRIASPPSSSSRRKEAPSSNEQARIAAIQLLAALHHQPPAWKGEWWAYHPVNQPPPEKSVAWSQTERVLGIFREQLDDASPTIRRASIEGLRTAKDTTAAPKLRALFSTDTDAESRRAILGALAAIKDAEARPLLVATLSEPGQNAAVLIEAFAAARSIRGDELNSAVLNILLRYPPDENVVRQALETIAELRVRDSVEAVRPYMTHTNSEIRDAALQALLKADPESALSEIEPLLNFDSPDVRRSAVVALGRLKSDAAVPALLEAAADPAIRTEAAVALAQTPTTRALDVYLESLRSENPKARDSARSALKAIEAEALPLIEARLRRLSPETLSALRAVYAKSERGRVLFANAPKSIEPEEYLAYSAQAAGNIEEGRALFHNVNGIACIKCHVVGSEGGRIGPDLTMVGAQFSRRELAESVLFPSRAVREGYQAVSVETRDGETVSGLFKGETAEDLTLMDSDGRVHQLRKSNIAERQLSSLSLMPEGLQINLTLSQFAGLISYLESFKGATNSGSDVSVKVPAGFKPLFNGRDLKGWKADAETAGHWRVRDGALEHDGVARDLWTERDFGNFVLQLEWRWPDEPKWEEFPVIGADGNEVPGADGKVKTERVLDAGDSGIFVRGYRKAQANLFCYPVGSGEVWEYRTDPKMSAEVHRGVTPKRKADRPIGAWNQMRITIEGDRMTVDLNGQEVITRALLPGLPARGPIGLQHEHGRIQFRNILVKEMP